MLAPRMCQYVLAPVNTHCDGQALVRAPYTLTEMTLGLEEMLNGGGAVHSPTLHPKIDIRLPGKRNSYFPP